MLSARSRILAEAMCKSNWSEFRVPSGLFLLFAHNHSAKIYGLLSIIIFYLCTTIRIKIRSPNDLVLLFAHNHSTKIYDPLSFILSFISECTPDTTLNTPFIASLKKKKKKKG